MLWKQILANDPESKPPAAYDKDYAQRNRGTLVEASGGYSYLRAQVQKPLMVLMIVVALVLLIACANVANLLLARATVRQREIAIRLAVGAAQWRLVAQLVIETLMIAVLGGIVGVGIAWWGVRVLLSFFPKRAVPLQFDLTPDWRLLAFSFGICLIVGLLCGIAPAVQTTRPDLTSALKNESAAAGRIRFDLRRALVVLQMATSLLLLIGAGLFVRSLSNLRSLDPGFVRESVLIVQTNPMALGYKSQPIREYYDRLIDRLRAVPTVRVASLAEITPLAGSRWNSSVTVEGYTRRADEKPWIDMNAVSPGYFATMGTPILAGRDFRPQDNPPFSPDPKPPTKGSHDTEPLPPPPPVAIVNQAFASQFFPHQSALGRHFTQDEKFDMAKSFEIVGVVKNSNYFDIRKQVEADDLRPGWRFGANGRRFASAPAAGPESTASAVRREMANVDAAIPILQTTTLEDQFDNTIAQERTVTTISGFFGSLAVLLAAMGLYGVMAYSRHPPLSRDRHPYGPRCSTGTRPLAGAPRYSMDDRDRRPDWIACSVRPHPAGPELSLRPDPAGPVEHNARNNRIDRGYRAGWIPSRPSSDACGSADCIAATNDQFLTSPGVAVEKKCSLLVGEGLNWRDPSSAVRCQ